MSNVNVKQIRDFEELRCFNIYVILDSSGKQVGLLHLHRDRRDSGVVTADLFQTVEPKFQQGISTQGEYDPLEEAMGGMDFYGYTIKSDRPFSNDVFKQIKEQGYTLIKAL